MTSLILASQSQSRRAILTGAGIKHQAIPSQVDEDEIKRLLLNETYSPADIAEKLAEAKAVDVSTTHPKALILGGDQVLEFRGRLFDKPKDMNEAHDRLLAMAGETHHLRAGLALAVNGEVIWVMRSTASLTMRPLSEDDVRGYLDTVGPRVLHTVGAYELEAEGVRLFEKIDGDYFSILGLPLLPLLPELRARGITPW